MGTCHIVFFISKKIFTRYFNEELIEFFLVAKYGIWFFSLKYAFRNAQGLVHVATTACDIMIYENLNVEYPQPEIRNFLF